MRRVLLLVIPLLLAGCWDEQNYNSIIHVPMAGISGELGELTVSFALPAIELKSEETRIITVDGRSFHDARAAANSITHNQLDTSMLTALLIDEESAKTNLYGYLDSFYRDVRNRLGMSVIITNGPVQPYIEKGSEFSDNINTFYSDVTKQLYENSQLPHMDLQLVCTYLFDEAIDLQLPYMEIGEESEYPAITGIALFDGNRFTGEIILMKQMVLMQVLKDDLGKQVKDVLMFQDAPMSYEIERAHRKVKIHANSVDLYYNLEVSILDYYPHRLKKAARRDEVEKTIEADLEIRAQKLFQQMKQANHDGLGIGQYYRAFRPKQYEENEWKEVYQGLTINTHFNVTVRDSGIID
ncbi:Ger(x)C family spore germination protein [Chryseomicrobium palamuruense]|uniref:Ger(X)C family spore germination protein n=1 Tax=Chryseomicrobium palamuruense TaxID=682973 RepID=A0ABV8UUD1_9BACL